MSDWSEGLDLGDLGGGYDPRLDPGIPDIGGGYDPRLDPNPPGGAYDPRLDPGMEGGGKVPQPFQMPKGFSIGDIAKGLGFLDANGQPNWAAILGALALGGGAAYSMNRTDKANEQYQEAIKQANAEATRLLGGNQAAFDPYKQAGLQGLTRLQNAPQSNLAAGFAPIADRFRPLGTGAAMGGGWTPMGGANAPLGLSLGNIARGR